MSLKIRKKISEKYCILQVIGEASSEEVGKLSRAINEAREKNSHLALDLAETTHLDSSALGILILNLKQLRKLQGELCLLAPSPTILEILGSSNLDQIFRIVDKKENL
jgi:anti-anti-sigma factor